MCISPISKTLGQPTMGGINPETATTVRSRLRCVNYRLTGMSSLFRNVPFRLTGNRRVAPVIRVIVSPTKRSPVQANPCFYFASINSRSLHNIALPAVLVPCVPGHDPSWYFSLHFSEMRTSLAHFSKEFASWRPNRIGGRGGWT
jgi:hypothetical protein